jgi:hypothetical protein
MLALLATLATVASLQSISISIGGKQREDSVKEAQRRARIDSLRKVAARRDSIRRAKRKIPITPEILATAFKDSLARQMLERSRTARTEQDSLLLAYDAKVLEDMRVGMGLGSFGRKRLLFGMQRAARVQWVRNKALLIDVLGARRGSGVVGPKGEAEIDIGDADWSNVPVPYFPGRETLWFGETGRAKLNIEDDEVRHPLTNGAEAYYTYQTGDTARITLPGDRVVRLRELKVRPRKVDWNVVVGSVWFEVETGRLVRAAYRMAEPLDIWAFVDEVEDEDDVPGWVKGAMNPMKGAIDAVTIEYGLMEGRFWLPRSQILEGKAQAGFFHFPFQMEQRFEYESVNGMDSVVIPQLAIDDTARDSASIKARRERYALECKDKTAVRRRISRPDSGSDVIRIVTIPCDTLALAKSNALPPSLYTSPEDLMPSGERDALMNAALSLGAQAEFGAPRPPRLHYGLSMSRYNRVEGFSTGLSAEQSFGAGYSWKLTSRLGVADLWPNVELLLSRSNGRDRISLGAFRRLTAANEWGDPLSVGSSISGVLFGRDEGFYYRSSGLELIGGPDGVNSDRTALNWRLFAEHHGGATSETDFSLTGSLGGRKIDDIFPLEDRVYGLQVRHRASLGLNPRGFRLLSDLRVEGAVGDFDYSRAALDLTMSRALGRSIDGSLTLSGGTSGGMLPPERAWYLGGLQSIRGQAAGAAVGNAYWMSHLEFGGPSTGFRPIIFGDIGWAGDRTLWRHPGRPLSGVGVGASILDGMIRFDLARGIYPEKAVRAGLYLEGRF